MPYWITEYAGTRRDPDGVGIMSEPAIARTQVSSGSSAASSTVVFQTGTKAFTLSGDIAAFFTVGSSTIAVSPSSLATRVPANVMMSYNRGLGANRLIGYST
jgi:hypothetical protein